MYFLLLLLLTTKGSAQTVVFSEDFENPTSWSKWTTAQPSTNEWYISVLSKYAGRYAAYISNTSDNTNTYDASVRTVSHLYRDISLPDGHNHFVLKFYWKSNGSTSANLKVYAVETTVVPVSGVLPASAALGTFMLSENQWKYDSVILPAKANQNFRLVFTWDNDIAAANQPPVTIDNLTITASCAAPVSEYPYAKLIEATEIDLAWQAGGTESAWELAMNEVYKFNPNDVAPVAVADSHFRVLAPGYVQAYYVRAVCGNATYSSWAGPYIVPSPVPFFEDFEKENGWYISNKGSDNKWIIGSVAVKSGNASAYISKDDGSTNSYDVTDISGDYLYRDFFIKGGTQTVLNFDWRSMGTCPGATLNVYALSTDVDIENDFFSALSPANALESYSLQNTWQNATVNLPVYTVDTVIRLAFEWQVDIFGGAIAVNPPAAVDNIRLLRSPAPAPRAFTVYTQGIDAFKLKWSPFGSEQLWKIKYAQAVDFDPNTSGIFVSTTQPEVNITGVTTTAVYAFYVKTFNTTGDSNEWVGPYHNIENFANGISVDWEARNGCQLNRWELGTAAAYVDNSKTLYISSDDGVSNDYIQGQTSVVHFCKEIMLQAKQKAAKIEFDLNMQEECEKEFYLRIYLVDPNIKPRPGTSLRYYAGAQMIGEYSISNGYFITKTINLPDVLKDVSKRLVFSFEQRFSIWPVTTATVPPAINNIRILSDVLPIPQALTAFQTSPTSAFLEWEAGLNETSWTIAFAEGIQTAAVGSKISVNTQNRIISIDGTKNYTFWVSANDAAGNSLERYNGPFFLNETFELDAFNFSKLSLWKINNGCQTNQFYHSDVVHPLGGSGYSVYISNHDGNTYSYDSSAASRVYMSRDVMFPEGFQKVQLTFDVRIKGDCSSDYLAVYATDPDDYVFPGTWFLPDDKYLLKKISDPNGISGTIVIDIPKEFVGKKRLAFAWINGPGLAHGNPPAAIDNIRLTASNIVYPEHLTVYRERNTALNDGFIASWEKIKDAKYYVLSYGGNTVNVYGTDTVIRMNLTGLNPVFKIQTVYQTNTSDWSPAVKLIHDFETDVDAWKLINECGNRWVIGAKATATKAAYIAPYGKDTNDYLFPTSLAYLALPVSFPTHAASCQMIFDWRSLGDYCDYMKFFISDALPKAGVEINTSFTDIRYRFKDTWQTDTFNFDPSYIGKTAYLIFEWSNSFGTVKSPPIALDNIRFQASSCGAAPRAITPFHRGNNSVVLDWTNNGRDTAWDIFYGRKGDDISSFTTIHTKTKPAVFTITSGISYELYMQAYYQDGCKSELSQAVSLDENFDHASVRNWNFVNGTQPNQWFVGDVAGPANNPAAYISAHCGADYYSFGASQTYFYRDITIPNGYRKVKVSFEWKNKGSKDDYMQVALGYPSQMPVPGEYYPGVAIPDAATYFFGADCWTSASVDVPSFFYGKTARLVFSYKTVGLGVSSPAAIDSISFSVDNYPAPIAMSAFSKTDTSALLSWAAFGNEIRWKVKYAPRMFLPNETIGVDSITVTENMCAISLKTTGDYHYYVQADYGIGGWSTWAGPFEFKETFETASAAQWHAVNACETSQWVLGTAAGGDGKTAYISKDNGTTNTYDNTQKSIVYFYRDIYLPRGYQHAFMMFDWRSMGQTGDELQVYLQNINSVPVPGTEPSGKLLGIFSGSSQWKSQRVNFGMDASGPVHLLFVWKNKVSASAQQPPVAIDNIQFFLRCVPPNEITVDPTVTKDLVSVMTWQQGESETRWQVQYGPQGFNLGNGTIHNVSILTDTLKNLQQDGYYDTYIHSVCSEVSFSDTAGPYTFRAPAFIDISDKLSNPVSKLDGASALWMDYDNDNLLDVFISGYDTVMKKPRMFVYKNAVTGNLIAQNAEFMGFDTVLAYGTLNAVDFDNDGNIDILMTGSKTQSTAGAAAFLYKNNGDGTFLKSFIQLPAVWKSTVAVGDFNNDGFPDILIAGQTPNGTSITKLYKNKNGKSLLENTTAFPLLNEGAVAFADLQRSGVLDIVVSGHSASKIQVFSNNKNETFTIKSIDIPNMKRSAIAVGDVDNDGLLDIAVAGERSAGTSSASMLMVYKNGGNLNFTNIYSLQEYWRSGTVAFADYDNDGFQDLIYSGISAANQYEAKVLQNTKTSSFTQASIFKTAKNPKIYFCDYDKDNRIDAFQVNETGGFLYRNKIDAVNTTPPKPTELRSVIDTCGITPDGRTPCSVVHFYWTKQNDVLSGVNGTTCNIRISDNRNTVNLRAPQAEIQVIDNGYKRTVSQGEIIGNTWSYAACLLGGTYYWNVQAIDGSIEGSPFSDIDSIVIPNVYAQAMNDTVICSGDSLMLYMIAAQETPTWSDGTKTWVQPTLAVLPKPDTSYYYVSVPALCGLYKDTVMVYAKNCDLPFVQYTLSGKDTLCYLETNTITLSGSEEQTYYQLYLNGDTLGTQVLGDGNPIIWRYTKPGEYTVEVYRHKRFEFLQTKLKVVVDSMPMLILPGDTTVCQYQIVNAQPFIYNGKLDPAFNQLAFRVEHDTTLTVTASNTCGQAKDSIKIMTLPAPYFTFVGDTAICKNDTLYLSINCDDAAATVVWNTGETTKNIQKRMTTSQNFIATTYSSTNQCSYTDTFSVRVESITAQLDYQPDRIYIEDPTVHFVDSSQGAVKHSWKFSDGYTSSAASFDHTFDLSSDTVLVLLKTTSAFGCTDSIIQLLLVEYGVRIYAPTAFTPNGDGLNDEFYLMIPNVETIEWYVFTRWGEKIFSADNIQARWDGYYSGKRMPPGVYTWKAKFKVEKNSEIHTATGFVTIVE